MNGKIKVLACVVGVAVAIILVWCGYGWYVDYRLRQDERRANECLNEFSRIVGDASRSVPAEKLAPLLEEMAQLSRRCTPGTVEVLFARRLDGYFLTGDFATVERMMDDTPGKTANWKFGAKAKVRAHAALVRGDKATAITEFETFCQALQKEPENAECDPYTGIEWPSEALLARNLKRMSGLAKDLGDTARAEKFLADARRYAKLAMEKAADDPDLKECLTPEFEALLK